MAATPILEEIAGSASGPMIANIAGLDAAPLEGLAVELDAAARPPRRLSIYAASAGFEMVEELAHLSARSIEGNVFFNPHFLAPAMPRLEDREVRLAVIRDGTEYRSRLRLLVPFSVEKSALPLGVSSIRTWSSPFGPLGTPLIDRDDPVGVVADFLQMLARPSLNLPKVLVLPEMRLDGSAAAVIKSAALSQGLAIEVTSVSHRAILDSSEEADPYLKDALSAHHLRGFRRMRRRLAEKGELVYRVARQPDDVRIGLETFLQLEASGWKGRERTAMAIDRFRAAFAREAVDGLARNDHCRVHELVLDGKVIASVVVFVESGVGYTWKTAYDEAYAAFSPGTLLMLDVTATHLADPNIDSTDSCAVPDHPVMNRIWKERRQMGTLIVGLVPGNDRIVRQAATQIQLGRDTRNIARILRSRVRKLIRR